MQVNKNDNNSFRINSQPDEVILEAAMKEILRKITNLKNSINHHYETSSRIDPFNQKELNKMQNKILILKMRLKDLDTEKSYLLCQKKDFHKSLHRSKIIRDKTLSLQKVQNLKNETKKIRRIIEIQKCSDSLEKKNTKEVYKHKFEFDSEVYKKIHQDSKDKMRNYFAREKYNCRREIGKTSKLNYDTNTKRQILNKIDKEYSKLKKIPYWVVKYNNNSVDLQNSPRLNPEVKNLKRKRSLGQNGLEIVNSAKARNDEEINFVDFMKYKGNVNKTYKLPDQRDFAALRRNSFTRTWRIDSAHTNKRAVSKMRPKLIKDDSIENLNLNILLSQQSQIPIFDSYKHKIPLFDSHQEKVPIYDSISREQSLSNLPNYASIENSVILT